MEDVTTTTTNTDAGGEQPAESQKRSRTSHPLRVLYAGATGSYQIVPGSPEFREQREWDAWVLANGKPGTAYAPGRIGPTMKLSVQLTEVDS